MRKTATILFAVAIIAMLAGVLSAPWWLPEAMMGWTDFTVRHAINHVNNAKSASSVISQDDYWYAAADLAYYITALVTSVGIIGTIVVILYGARQVSLATSNLRSTARQQQMRMLFDLDLALLNHPEVLALSEGRFGLDPATLMRAKSSAFAHAFLNGCDTVHDYYKVIDPNEDDRYWVAWRTQLSHYLVHRPELRAIARDSIERKFYTPEFRAELQGLINEAERQADSEHRMRRVVVGEAARPPSGAPVLRELSDSEADAAILRSFYNTVYVREFPNPDERESLENMESYLRERKPAGWYGKNNYHIVVAELGGGAAALCVADYVAAANVGIIEFLVVAPELRGRGIGQLMLDHVEALGEADARRAHGSGLRGIVAEMNDPFRTAPAADTMDPFDRAALWHRWGFRLIDMPYVQPALSEGQSAVECLMLLGKPLLPPFDAWPAADVQAVIRDYLIYAMRFEDPRASPEFLAMERWLGKRTTVPLRSLGAAVGREPR